MDDYHILQKPLKFIVHNHHGSRHNLEIWQCVKWLLRKDLKRNKMGFCDFLNSYFTNFFGLLPKEIYDIKI